MNEAPQLDEADRPRADSPRAATMKFAYGSGARPLDGYTIKRGVGRGGFGEVYFATSDAGKEVALKLIRRNLDVELRGVTQCLNLKHPNLIALYDIRTDEQDDQWVVMEYVSGESLEEVIERNPQGMPLEEALCWMRGIAAGVAYLHDHGIVHRDLKPGNIFSDEGIVKIGDYGLSKFISCSRRSGQTESVGTVHYMAPEIANGRYGQEIDTYALGIILFEMLTGHVPFEGESVGEVLMKHLTAEPDLTALAEPYRDIVSRALAKDPNLRLKTVGELVALLPAGAGEIPPQSYRPAIPLAAAPQPQASSETKFEAAGTKAAGSGNAASPFPKPPFSPFQPGIWGQQGKVEEPIARAIRDSFANFHNAQPLMRGLTLLGLVMIVVMWHDTAFSLIAPIAMCYFIYYIIWQNINKRQMREAAKAAAANAPPLPANAYANANTASVDARTAIWRPAEELPVPANARQAQQTTRRIRSTWRDRANQQLATKPLREKFSELIGSMLLAAIFSALAACVVPFVLRNQSESEQFASYAWLAVVGTLGSWAVLVPSKFAEGKVEDQTPLRLTLLLLGTLVGLAAWGLGDALMLKAPGWREPIDVGRGLITHEMLGWQLGSDTLNPAIAVYTSYFAFLFLVPRWWRQTDFTRNYAAQHLECVCRASAGPGSCTCSGGSPNRSE